MCAKICAKNRIPNCRSKDRAGTNPRCYASWLNIRIPGGKYVWSCGSYGKVMIQPRYSEVFTGAKRHVQRELAQYWPIGGDAPGITEVGGNDSDRQGFVYVPLRSIFYHVLFYFLVWKMRADLVRG